jgi:hypothetical protein
MNPADARSNKFELQAWIRQNRVTQREQSPDRADLSAHVPNLPTAVRRSQRVSFSAMPVRQMLHLRGIRRRSTAVPAAIGGAS